MKMSMICAFLLALGVPMAAQDKVEQLHFGNTKCPMTGKDVDSKYWVESGGQKVWFCCKECKAKAKTDPAAAVAKAYPADKVIDVKNETCPCLGKPAKEDKTVVFQGHKVRICCDGCEKKFKEEPNRYLAVAKNKDLKVVGNPKCPVMTDDAVVKDLYISYKGHLVGICCDSCVEEFAASPSKFMKALGLEKN